VRGAIAKVETAANWNNLEMREVIIITFFDL
jgi:hypothetical protein